MKKMNLRNYFLILLFFGLNHSCFAQNPAPTYNVPNIIPTTPTAQAFQRYGEIPVDYSTGVPSIEIPLYTVTSRRLSVPLSLSYHASGIKVADMSNDIGLGWSLQGKAMITRTVVDRPDDGIISGFTNQRATYTKAEDFYNAKAAATTHLQQTALSQEIQNDIKYRDRQSDRYSYQLPGKGSGVFRFDFNTGQAVTLPYKPGITPGIGSITDESGTIYTFGKAIWSENYGNGSNNSYTSWYITSIETPDHTDKIEYTYTSFVNSYTQASYFQTARNGYSNPVPNCYGGTSGTSENTNSVGYFNADEPLIDEINSATTRVKFTYANDRVDIPTDIMGKKALYRLVSIKIYDKLSNSLVKEITLQNNTYFDSGSGNKRLKLNSVSFLDKNEQNPQTYTVAYEPDGLPSYTSFSQDFWGYFNGASNGGLIPSEFATPGMSITYGGNRRPNHGYAKASMIKEIQYPTGGKTSFEFEPNSNNQGLVGGFRIKKITSTALTPTGDMVKTYAYENPRSLDLGADKFKYIQNYFYWWPWVDCGAGNGSINDVGSFYGDNVIQSSPVSPIMMSSGTPVVYTKVSEYIGTTSVNTGKTEYYYSSPEDADPVNQPRYYGNNFYDNGNYEPRLLNKWDYKNNGTGYDLIKEINNTYTPYMNYEYHMGVNVVKESSEFVNNSPAEESYYQFDLTPGQCCNPCANGNCYNGYLEYFNYYNTTANEKAYFLTSTEEKTYAQNGSVNFTSTTNMGYGDMNQSAPTSKSIKTSTGEWKYSAYNYPASFYGDPSVQGLLALHMYNPLILQSDFGTNNNFLRSAKTYYTGVPGINSNTIQVPSYIESTQGSSLTETRLRYHKYDVYGNVLEVSKENDVHEVYLYGYNSAYPVAKIIGTTYDIAKTYITQSVLDNPTDDVSLRAHLNNLRNIPNSLVSTYTYKPLVGATSETDPNGKTIYYEYDAFNRLILIRDKDNNILKKICYNYAGQPENCIVPCTNFTPNWQNTTTALRCQQGSCGAGSYSGYQEQEQKDINPCSPTYNQLQWVQAAYNPTVCVPTNCIALTSTNLSGYAGYVASYYNNTTGLTYNLPVSAASGLQSLGSIPEGTYTLTISRTTGTQYYGTFYSGCGKKSASGTSATFYSVPISSTGCLSIKIDFAQ